MSIHGVLGETTSYPTSYDASVLFAISRQLGREVVLAETGVAAEQLSEGVDVWQAFELSWLDTQGISQVALARLFIPANSPNIVESKSLKLYFNSLNFTKFDNAQAVKTIIEKDLSACIGASVSVQIEPLTTLSFAVNAPAGECIDQALAGMGEVALVDEIDASMLANAPIGTPKTYHFHSNLLRSNCPVTNQPDWGTLMVQMTTDKQLNFADILKYILTFRKHNGFHEQCVERIFADFLTHFAPSALCVQANYTRRGGIDINPVRVKNMPLPTVARQVRQ